MWFLIEWSYYHLALTAPGNKVGGLIPYDLHARDTTHRHSGMVKVFRLKSVHKPSQAYTGCC
jgi:hypothetical protein